MKKLAFSLRELGSASYREKVKTLAGALRGGGAVAFPTDTVFGVAALAVDARAVASLFELKGREASKALPVFFPALSEAARWLEPFPPEVEDLAERFWPGALTIVARPLPGRLSAVVAADGTVAVRVPDVALLRELLAELQAPVACTSANRSGEPPLQEARAVEAALGHGLSVLAMNDEPTGRSPSTVVTWRDGQLIVLREGAISGRDLAGGLRPNSRRRAPRAP